MPSGTGRRTFALLVTKAKVLALPGCIMVGGPSGRVCRSMSSILGLPPELVGCLNAPQPRSILIRGPAGTGKTTLALSFLEQFTGPSYLVTGRVSRTRILADFPWLTRLEGKQVTILDGTREGASARPSPPSGTPSPPTDGEPPSAAGPGLHELPPPFREIDSQGGPGPLLVIVDPWDSVVEEFVSTSTLSGERSPDPGELERTLLQWAGSRPICLVLVREKSGPDALDYRMDCVLELEWDSRTYQRERWLHLRKLRGAPIQNPSYPFTLADGRFRCLKPLARDVQPRLLPPAPDPDANGKGLWPGHAQFFSHFGRLPLGGITLLDCDGDLPPNAIRLVIAPILAQVLGHGGNVVQVLPPYLRPAEIWQYYGTFMGNDAFLRQVRLQFPGGLREEVPEMAMSILPPPMRDTSFTEPRMPEILGHLRQRNPGGTPNLLVTWIAGLEALGTGPGPLYTPENLPIILTQVMAGAPAAALVIGRRGDRLSRCLRPMSSLWIRLRFRAGRVLLHGCVPRTGPLLLAEGDNGTAYNLVPLV